MDAGYLRHFLHENASAGLIGAIGAARASAEANGTCTHLAHLLDRLLDEKSIRSRVDEAVRTRAQAALAEYVSSFPKDDHPGSFAFVLEDFARPAMELARDSSSTKVTPVIFLATCLSAAIDTDAQSSRAREALRAAGLTHDLLVPKADPEAAQRADFTFQSLGYGTDITAMVRAGFWTACPLVGMEAEMKRLAIVLTSMRYSAAVVGEPGVGKSAFIQGFAWHLVRGTRPLIPPRMDSWTVVMIEAVDLMKGTGVRGDLETRVKDMTSFFKRNPTVIPFFEEVHRLLDSDDTASRSVATALKPPMALGLFRCVGVTTDREYSRFIASDDAMNSRFRKILLPEPDQDTAVRIIKGARANLLSGRAREIGVDLDDEAIGAAVRITSTYQKSDRLPRKAINLLAETVSKKVYDVETLPQPISRQVMASDVAEFFSDVTGIPVDDLSDDRNAYYRRLADRLKTQIKEQDHAIDGVTSWLALHSSGWVDPRRPRGRFLFLGPPGVGKTELALALAAEVMRDRGSLITLNMGDFKGESARNKFLGADPGYVGYGQTPTIFTKVMMRPYSVVVLDEIEKADPSLADVLISVLDGHGEDSQGRAVDFSQCIFVMTSNAIMTGAQDEDGQPSDPPAGRDDGPIRRRLRKSRGIWTPAFVDRIDRITLFRSLSVRALAEILDGMIDVRRRQTRRPLPAAIDSVEAKAAIIAAAREGDHASARRLERALLTWLERQAIDDRAAGTPTVDTDAQPETIAES